MPDDKTDTSPQDAWRINLSEDDEGAWRMRALGVSGRALERAGQAGRSADAACPALRRGSTRSSDRQIARRPPSGGRPRRVALLVMLIVLNGAPVFALGDGTRPGAGLPLCSNR